MAVARGASNCAEDEDRVTFTDHHNHPSPAHPGSRVEFRRRRRNKYKLSEARADFSHRRWRRPLACRSRRRPASVPGREDVSPSGFTGGPPRRAGAARQALAEAPRGGLLPLPRLPAGGRPWLWRRWASSAEYCFCTHVSLALTSDRARQGCRCLAREIFCPHLFLAFRGVHR